MAKSLQEPKIVVPPSSSQPGDLILRVDMSDHEVIIQRHAKRGVFPTIIMSMGEASALVAALNRCLNPAIASSEDES